MYHSCCGILDKSKLISCRRKLIVKASWTNRCWSLKRRGGILTRGCWDLGVLGWSVWHRDHCAAGPEEEATALRCSQLCSRHLQWLQANFSVLDALVFFLPWFWNFLGSVSDYNSVPSKSMFFMVMSGWILRFLCSQFQTLPIISFIHGMFFDPQQYLLWKKWFNWIQEI